MFVRRGAALAVFLASVCASASASSGHGQSWHIRRSLRSLRAGHRALDRSEDAGGGALEADLQTIKEEREAEEADETTFKWTCVVAILALAGTFIVGQLLESKHITRLPEAGVGVLMGMLASGAASFLGNEVMIRQERFDFEFFMVYLLPPIIFEAGFNMNTKAFVDNIGPTMFYAFVGTFGSTFIVGGVMYAAGQLGLCYPLGLLASLVFGSLISATDPVTVLAVFQALGVKVDLFSMVFGESVLNDAVAIVLSTTLLSFNDPSVEVNYDSIMGAVSMFLSIFIGSLVIGLAYGLISAIVFKKLDLRHHPDMLFLEAVLSFTFPWAAYYTSEACHFSGIVTILFCGMVMATYTRYNFSTEAVQLTARAFKCVALLAETYVFVYLGMAVFAFPIFDHTVYKAVAVGLFACFIGRGHIYIGSWLFNAGRTTAAPGEEQVGLPKISDAYMFVMWFSGLRGGVAFALASVSYANKDFDVTCGGFDSVKQRAEWGCDSSEMTDSLAIMQITLLIAVFTIFVFGGAITEVAVAYDVLEKKHHHHHHHHKQPTKVPPESAWSNFNNLTLMPLLTFAEEVSQLPEESEARFEAAMSQYVGVEDEDEDEDESGRWGKARSVLAAATIAAAGKTSKEVKEALSGEELEMVLRGVASVEEVTLEDKVDEVRVALPHMSTAAVKKLLQESSESVHDAIVLGQSRGFS